MTKHFAPSLEVPVAAIDAALAEHAFGDSAYITERLHFCYKRRLGTLAASLPAAGQLLEALEQAGPEAQYRTIGDTVVRCAIQQAHVQVECATPYGLPLPQCEALMLEAAALLREGGCAPLGLGLPHKLGDRADLPWVWSDERRDDRFARAFRDIVRENYGEADLHSPDAGDLEILGKGLSLLTTLLPSISRSALTHTHFVLLFPTDGPWATRMSSSEFRISGTIFFSRNVLSNPWVVAEHLFHETLHQQLYDIRAGHTLLEPGFNRADAPMIHSPWNKPDSTRGNYWDVHRAIAAFHVYVHLTLLATAAEQRAAELREHGPNRMVGRRTAAARARYLEEQLRGAGWSELGPAGRRVVDWFGSILDLLDPVQPAPGACVHLFLDRYWREANEVARVAANAEEHARLTPYLRKLVDEEISKTRSVLGLIDGDRARFDQAIDDMKGKDPADHFLSARTLVAETLLLACADGLRLPHAGDELVRDMVEDSSEVLRSLLET